jgi:hypothetical protein
MRYPTHAVTQRLIAQLGQARSQVDESGLSHVIPRYSVTAPDGRRFESLDLPALARLLHDEGLGKGWRIATA